GCSGNNCPAPFDATQITRNGKYQPWGWAFQILPQLDQENIHRSVRDAPSALFAQTKTVKILTCPSRRAPTAYPIGSPTPKFLTDYAGNAGVYYVDSSNPQQPAVRGGTMTQMRWNGNQTAGDAVVTAVRIGNLRGGASHTLLVGEKYVSLGGIAGGEQ